MDQPGEWDNPYLTMNYEYEGLTAAGIRFILAHAKKLRAIAEATYKSDAVDAELLARMGWPEGPIVMLGDDLKMDIGAARALGC